MPRRLLAVPVVLLVVLAAPAATSPATHAAPPLTATRIDAADPAGNVIAERVIGSSAADPAQWRVNSHVLVANSTRRPYSLVRSQVCYASGPSCASRTYDPSDPETPVVKPGSWYVPAAEPRDHPFPLASSIQITLELAATGVAARQTVTISKPLVEYKSKVAGGGYLFPGGRQNLPDGWYWADGQNHVDGSNHRESTSQRFALDLTVRRWDGKAWTKNKIGMKTASVNADLVVWEMPVRAMADGWVLNCRKSIDENELGVRGSGGGNLLRIVHADGEVALYAHLRKGSVPDRLCPEEGKDFSPRTAPRVKAGEQIGRVGNTGQSTGPHLHVHVGTTGKTGEQGLPLPFRNVRTRTAGADWKSSRPCDPKNPSFAVSSPPAAVDQLQLIEPFWPGATELARHAMPEACFQDFVEGAAASGYWPFWFDGYDVGKQPFVNAVFRPGGGQWVMRHKLDAAAYQSEITNWYGRGYRPTLVESYREGNALRYAFVAVKRGATVVAYHGKGEKEHTALANDYKGKGYAPVSVAVVSLEGKLFYTALWEKGGGGWLMLSKLTGPEYQKWLETNAKNGRRLVYVNAYHHDGKPQFSAIVSSNASKSYVARHDLTAGGYQTEYTKWTGQGRRTEVVTGYRSGSSHRFAALWR